MPVYFIYRSHYDTPSLNYLLRFEDDTVLAWFQRHWVGVSEDNVGDHVERVFGRSVYGFGSLFRAIAEHGLKPPTSSAVLKRLLETHLYVEGELVCRPHVIQVLTDDDELEMAYYFFDDHYLAENPDKAVFLLHEDWRLPDGSGPEGFKPSGRVKKLKPKGKGAGTTYLAFLAWYDSCNLGNLEGGWSISGLRLADLPRYLATTVPPPGYPHEGGWPFELKLLRSQLLLEDPDAPHEEQALLAGIRAGGAEPTLWQVHADWLEEHGQGRNAVLERALRQCGKYPVGYICNSLSTREVSGTTPAEAREELASLLKDWANPRENDPEKSLTQGGDHVAQLVLHTGRMFGRKDLYHRWVLFDDLWCGAHPVLANAILRYAARWDVLR
jgi:uncharacterized protein (TIGR02996 family)